MFPSNNPQSVPYDEYSRFDLDNTREAECKAEFRFDKEGCRVLVEALQIPPSFKPNQGGIVNSQTLLRQSTEVHVASVILV